MRMNKGSMSRSYTGLGISKENTFLEKFDHELQSRCEGRFSKREKRNLDHSHIDTPKVVSRSWILVQQGIYNKPYFQNPL